LLGYLNELEELCAKKNASNDDWLVLDKLEEALKVSSACWVKKVTFAKISATDTTANQFDHEKHGSDIVAMSKAHMMYMSFMISRKLAEDSPIKCANLRTTLLLVLKVFALKVLTNDSMPLFDTGYL
jgi:hypothetical protein